MSPRHAGPDARRVMLLGGTSEIGLAIVRELQARSPREVQLVGRDAAALQDAAASLRAAGAPRVLTTVVEATALGQHRQAIERAISELGGADIVILAVGILGERGGLPADIGAAAGVLEVNLVGAGSLLMHAARCLSDAGGGSIVVLSSVAAERARRANVVYGASKAGLDSLAQGLGDALRERGVSVMVVRPGFVRTRMTEGLAPAPLATTPQAVAGIVADGLAGGEHTVWAPRSLRWVMLAIRHLPRPLLRRINS